MKIAVITDVGSGGGATIAAERLCIGLRRRGHFVARLYGKGSDPAPDSADAFFPLNLNSDWPERIWTVSKTEFCRRYLQSKWVEEFRKVLSNLRPDAINIHNLHGRFWDVEVVEECLRHVPVVWTMHDQWPFTGSCAYSYECRKFESACDRACPQLGVYPTLPARLIPPAHQRRKKFYESKPKLVQVSPSRWLANEARKMTRDAVPSLAISNGIDLEIFRPMNRNEARALLKIPADDKPTLMAAAASLADQRKGLHLLLLALEKIKPQSLRLLLLGNAQQISAPSHVEVIHLGAVSGDPFLNIAYNAADILCHPALMDNQPLVVMEAMACGKPAVALPVGGVPEMVINEMTGWLAEQATAESLASVLEKALAQRAAWTEFSKRCRLQAEREYALPIQAQRYEYVFQSLIGGAQISQESLQESLLHK